MFKFIIFVFIVLFVIGSGNIFDVSSDVSSDFWLIKINHQELLGSVFKGFNIIYDFIVEIINTTNTTTPQVQSK